MLKVMVLVASLMLVLVSALPAWAQSGCEIAHECASDYADRGWVPPGYENSAQLYAWDYLTQTPRMIGLYGLAAFCYNYGGYYYVEDGAYYWHSCS
jgi:hypothetical protein